MPFTTQNLFLFANLVPSLTLRAFTLTTLGVWLVQIPDVKMWIAAGHWPASVCAYLDLSIETALRTFGMMVPEACCTGLLRHAPQPRYWIGVKAGADIDGENRTFAARARATLFMVYWRHSIGQQSVVAGVLSTSILGVAHYWHHLQNQEANCKISQFIFWEPTIVIFKRPKQCQR